MPLFSGSGAVKIMDLYEDEPNDDYESYAMRQRMRPHGGQLMMTTQVTTKVPPKKYVNIPSEKYIYVHIYMCVYVYIHTYVKWMSAGLMPACHKNG